MSEYQEIDEYIYEGDDRSQIIERIISHPSKCKPSEMKFINGVEDYREKHGKITVAQFNALANIYNELNME